MQKIKCIEIKSLCKQHIIKYYDNLSRNDIKLNGFESDIRYALSLKLRGCRLETVFLYTYELQSALGFIDFRVTNIICYGYLPSVFATLTPY